MIRSIVRAFFTPGVFILNRFRYPVKFLLISILLILPLAVSTYSFVSGFDDDIVFAQKERVGVQYVLRIRTLLQNIQQHRGLVSAFYIDNQSFAPRLVDKAKEIILNEKAIDMIDQKYGGVLATTDEWTDIKREWRRVLSRAQQSTPEESYQMHTALTERLVLFLSHIGDTSNLILDPFLDRYHLANSLINRIPSISESLGQMRAFGLALPQAKEITQGDKRLFIALSSAVNSEVQKMNRGLEVAYGYTPALQGELSPQATQTMKEIDVLLSVINTDIITAKTNTLKADEYYELATHSINEVFRLYDLTEESLDSILQADIARLESKKDLVIGIMVVLVLLIGYFFIGLYISIRHMVSILRLSTDKLAKGEHIGEIQLDARDELFEVALLFNKVAEALLKANTELKTNVEKRIVLEKEMATRQEEIERFNDLMIGRELKMAELKKELEELKSGGGGEKERMRNLLKEYHE